MKGLLCFSLFCAALQSPLLLAADADEIPQTIDPQIERTQVSVAKIKARDIEGGLYTGAIAMEDFGVNALYGIRLTYHITEQLFTVASFAQSQASKTSFERLSGSSQLLGGSQRDYSYYNVSIGYDVLPGEAFFRHSAYNAALYVVGGLGSTRFADDDHFTLSFGGGYRLLPTGRTALYLEGRDHTFATDILGKERRVHNLEAHLGISLFF